MSCSGLSAGWCPNCGDCICPRNGDSWEEYNTPGCPLHGETSKHGEMEEYETIWGTLRPDEEPLIVEGLT